MFSNENKISNTDQMKTNEGENNLGCLSNKSNKSMGEFCFKICTSINNL